MENVKGILKSNKGFTLLELIVVVAIIGFLVAMVAPRFIGVVDAAKEPTRDSNVLRLMNAMETYHSKEGLLPTNMRTLAISDGTPYGWIATGGEHIWRNVPQLRDSYIADRDPGDGKELLSAATAKTNMALHTHVLNDSEIHDLRRMGITHVIPYKQVGEGPDRQFVPGDKIELERGKTIQVLMIGSGAADREAEIATGKIIPGHRFANFSEPDLMYRIVLGIGEESTLVTKGYVGSLGQCPGSTQKDLKSYNAPLVVLPRLDSTIDRLAKGAPREIKVQARDEDRDLIPGMTRVVRIDKPQEDWAFGVAAPNGVYWPEGEHKTGWRVVAVTP
ncbi:prepilin-type N-terminal cleavage/methylation domain-containing protein [Peptococcaceae bacterium]|nr:prepilin-type N-terminal cleavage/methylation domain-containing protein [Peptococcaceae bacterium]